MRILIIEDDSILGDAIQAGLRQHGFNPDWFMEGEDGLLSLETNHYEAVVLDIGLPDLPGLEVLKRARARGVRLPMLLLTARDAVSDRVKGLDTGADDYLTKPFSMEELAARLRALIRRNLGTAEPLLRSGALALDPATRKVTVNGDPVELPKREFTLLQQLLLNAGKVLSRERLEEILYGMEEEVESNAVEVHIHHLRRKIGAERIRTIRGVGYLLEKEKCREN